MFQGRGVFLELGHFVKHSPKTREKKCRREKISIFCLETLENFISNEKFYPQMTTIRAFFLQIRALFSDFRKREGETSLPPPHPPLVTRVTVLIQKFLVQILIEAHHFRELSVLSRVQANTQGVSAVSTRITKYLPISGLTKVNETCLSVLQNILTDHQCRNSYAYKH